jgi:GntR family transcriptional regulator, transcriptional repressor for pyruvate dehydrogenase complex
VARGARQALVRVLLDRIEKAHALPGSRLPGERELASSFGASGPRSVRCWGVLEVLRVIERRPQSGIYSHPSAAQASLEDLVLREALDMRSPIAAYEQAQEARIIHEVEAVRAAAKRRTCANLDAMRGATHEPATTWPTTTRPFIWPSSLGQKPDLVAYRQVALLITHSVRRAYFDMPGTPPTSIVKHERILDSVAGATARGPLCN